MIFAPFSFANDDRTLPASVQPVKSVSEEELLNQLLYHAVNHHILSGHRSIHIDPYTFYKSVDGYDTITDILENEIPDTDIQFANGFQYLYMDLSNIEYRSYPNDISLLGVHTLSNGFSFIGCMTGLEDTCGSFVALYHDGDRFRIWEPVRGNTVNYDLLHCPLKMPRNIAYALRRFKTYAYYPKAMPSFMTDRQIVQNCLLIRYYRNHKLWTSAIAKTADYNLDLALDMANALRYGSKDYLSFPLYHRAMEEEMVKTIQVI